MNLNQRLSDLQPSLIFRSGIIFYILFSLSTIHLPFFGDHVSLISAPANYFYDTGLRSLILPTELDTGHPPFYPYLHACFWKLFGKNLVVSHLISLVAMLFLFYQFSGFCKRSLSAGAQKIALLFFLVQPVLLAQFSLMSTDILLCGLFLSGLNAIQNKKNKQLIFSIAVALLISVRGIMVCGFLGIAILLLTTDLKTHIKNYFFIFFFSAIPAAIWYWFHYVASGWFLTNPQSPWATGREFVGWPVFPAAVFEYIFRYVEFGMLLPWCILLFSINKIKADKQSKKFWFLLIAGFAFISLFIIFFKNPVMVRYILPVQLLVLVLSAKSISLFTSRNLKITSIAFCILFFIAQHFYAYPQTKSSVFEYSWGEGSLAHLSYFIFRDDGAAFLASKNIPPEKVFTGFPEYKSFHYTDLRDGRQPGYGVFRESEMSNYPYVIYSNIMNGISKAAETELKTHWIRMKTYYAYPVEYIIFQNPDN